MGIKFAIPALEHLRVPGNDLPSAAMVQCELGPIRGLYDGGQILDKGGVCVRWFQNKQENQNRKIGVL